MDSVDQLLELQHLLEKKLSAIDGSGELIERLRCQVEENRRTATSLALQLSAARAKAAEAMEAEMRTKLLPLGMPNAQFRCEVVTDEQTLTPKGCDQVQFLFNAN